jgi:PQQ-dependent dehydrogenase (methanol/ethanol family)
MDTVRDLSLLRQGLGNLMIACTAFSVSIACAGDVTFERIVNADHNPDDWLTYHGTYESWHYSSLSEINNENVQNLREVWSHAAARSVRGLQSMPLVADGSLYYSGSFDQVWALDGATGEVRWYYKQNLNEEVVSKQTHSPFNRGIALGWGNVYIGTSDGKLVAIDMATGKQAWETKLIDSEKLTVGFSGAPLLVKDKVIIGGQGGEWPVRGALFGVDAKSGKQLWRFDTVGGNEGNGDARNTWGNDSWKTGGGGAWMPGGYDVETDTVYWGTANPNPLFDWAGPEWKTSGPRPGDNLYTSSVIGLDPDSGRLKSYYQELPHDVWDFDSAVGEFVLLERDGKKYVVHPNKGGHIFVYNRSLKLENVWQSVKNVNFVTRIDPKTGELIGRRDMPAGKHSSVCPSTGGGFSWNSGTYNPMTGLYYKINNEWCMDVEVVKTTPILEPTAQLNIGAITKLVAPAGDKIYGHVDARDPINGEKKWEIYFPEPPLASLLSTAGNLLFVPDARGILHAYDVRDGRELWSYNDGQGHNGGIISYRARGHQYIAVMTGWGGLVGDRYAPNFDGIYLQMPKDSGVLKAFALVAAAPQASAAGNTLLGATGKPAGAQAGAAQTPTKEQKPSVAAAAPAPGPQAAAPAFDVERLFANTCGYCHDNGGRTAGIGPQLMGTRLSDDDIVNRIKNGKPGAMPAFGTSLTDDQLKAVVAYIRGLKP